MSVLSQSVYTPKVGLSSVTDAWRKYEDKVTDVLDSNQNIETTCKSKFTLTERKYLLIKSTEKLVKDECM